MISESTDYKKYLAEGVVGALSVDVEDWYHILETGAAPVIGQWASLESRIESSLERILELLDNYNIHATFFWLGWLAKRHPKLVTKCKQQGHEIASHGYAHLLPWDVGHKLFKNDADLAKKVLEDVTGEQILGYRTAGFGITNKAKWALDIIAEAGYKYDSSIIPTFLEHGKVYYSECVPFAIPTQNGLLIEIPMSTLKLSYLKIRFVGGGYLRLLPKWFIRLGINHLQKTSRPLIVYIHPREIDLDHPHLPLNFFRHFRCYFNLKSTMPKLKWLCENYSYCTMRELAENFEKSLNQASI